MKVVLFGGILEDHILNRMRKNCTYRSLLKNELPYVYDIDGNVYHYVKIGNQEWMVENFKSTKYADGTAIPNLTLNADWNAEDGTVGHDGAYCWYDNDITNKEDYGAMYNWYARVNAHGLAPTKWRVASETDWNTLISFLGGDGIAGGKLKEIGLSHWTTPNLDATDEYGFKLLPGGERHPTGVFYNINNYAFMGCSTEFDASDAYWYNMGYNWSNVFKNYESKKSGFSVRMMRDTP